MLLHAEHLRDAAEPGDKTSALMRALLAVPEWRDMYFRRLRTLVNDVLAAGRPEAVYDAGWVPPSRWRRWTTRPGPTRARASASRRTATACSRPSMLDAPSSRRTRGCRATSRPPEHRDRRDPALPTAGDTAEFVELYNPTRAGRRPVRLAHRGRHRPDHPAGHRDPAALDDDVRQQRPRLPRRLRSHGVRRRPLRRQPRGERQPHPDPPDGTTADTVTYGGAGWPVPTSGQSLELTDLAADNNNGANWRLSAGSGSPGTTAGAVVTAPGTPTIGTATPGNASATVTWTAPDSTGGSAVTGYQVRVVNAAGTQVGALRPAGAADTSLVVTGLTNGTAYRFQVAATNSVGTGGFSALSNTVTPSASAGVPGAPVIGTPSQGAIGGELTAIARWSAPPQTAARPSRATRSPRCG